MEVSHLASTNFKKLYKKTSTGAIQEWSISVKDNEIHTVYGQVGGKLQSTVDIIKAGKNVGRLNFSYGKHDGHGKRIKQVREAAERV